MRAANALSNGVSVMNTKSSWNVYRTRFLVRARQLTEPLVFTDLFGREQSGRPGDYLVETSNGIRRITNKDVFEDIYVPVALESTGLSADHVQKRPAAAVLERSGQRASTSEHVRATA